MKTLDSVFQSIDEGKSNLEFIKTGINSLDDLIDGGFLRKELIVLGGHSGGGKSYLAGTIFWNAVKQGLKSSYFSLEISNEMVVSRLIGAIANIKPIRVMTGILDYLEIETKAEAKAELSAYDQFMYFYDDVYQLDKIYKEIKDNQYEFVVIDFIQNVMAPGADEYSRLSSVALQLQKIAKELNCCILILSQLSNQVAREKTDTVLEFKGSGSIATVCDIGLVITRGTEWSGGGNELFISLRKNRRGISGKSVSCGFKSPGGMIS